MYKVLIEECTYENCFLNIKKIFDEFPLSIKNKKVLVKPNVLRGAKPEESITTHPKILRSVIDILETFNPKEIIVGDNCGLQNNEECFKQCGLIEASKGYYRNIDNEKDSYIIKINNKIPFIKISKEIIEAEIIISLPKFKTHSLTTLTGAIKNSYGFLPGKQKIQCHKLAGNSIIFQQLIVDIFKIKIPNLFIMDAIVGMEGNGPSSTDLRTINKIIASDNGVCLDSVVSYMMGVKPYNLLFLKKSYEEKLGEINLEKIKIIGKLEKIKNFRLPSVDEHYIGLFNKPKEKKIKHRINKNTCTICGLCSEQCPVDAITINNSEITINEKQCIYCFCCQEICPNKAITIC